MEHEIKLEKFQSNGFKLKNKERWCKYGKQR